MARTLSGMLALALSMVSVDAAASCVEAAIERLDLPVHRVDTVFVEPGQDVTRSWQLERAQCVSVLALARRPHVVVDAVLRADTGQDLASDGPETPYAFLRFCGAAGVALHWTISTTAATEVQAVAFAGSPDRVPDWGREVGDCFAGAPGMRIADPELGTPPPAASAEARVDRRAQRLRRRGYREVMRDEVVVQDRLDRELGLEGGRCYALWAVPEVGAVDIALMAPDGREVGADRRRDVDGGIGYCPTMSGQFTLAIHDLGGVQSVRFLMVEQTRGEVAPGLTGPAARAFVETRAMEGELEAVGWVHLHAGESLTLPVRWGDGCHALVAIPGEEVWARSALTLQLEHDDEVLSTGTRDPRRAGVALLHHCGAGEHVARVRVRRGNGRVWIGSVDR